METSSRPNRPVTVAEVAARAGVSISTVSKAVNGTGQLRPETRQRVLQSARELNFQPNQLARGLLSGRSYTVGILSTDDWGRFTLPLLAGAEDALGAGQLSMLLCESRGDPIREQHYLRTLTARRVDGIIVTGHSRNVRPSLRTAVNVPVVYAVTVSDHLDDVSVTYDDTTGAIDAVNHLLATGRRDIAVVMGPERHVASQHRLDGAMRALQAAGLQPVLGTALFGEWSERWGRDAAARLVNSSHPVDGVFAASDQIARGITEGIREAGLRSPDDIGVVGVDNWNVIAEASRPPLTTVDLNLEEVGRRAANRLLEAMEGGRGPAGVELIPTWLAVRQSSEAVLRPA
ncbi:LacI family DNA-binding transcriptional regulator [Microbacterium sp. RU33B]|uniref:LacI family DNA-binding transcriptional regulator n=1 Tax=Microbacterium sp. RU33B TaxID=1907390 RepID=UPI0009641D59|nr:LacI family DNA-binding transcriptional regulator [Microbacterium sp. RU33B]SIT67428.1 transcriptional regulator, LacI family [Microbacterium sp. RU33B]